MTHRWNQGHLRRWIAGLLVVIPLVGWSPKASAQGTNSLYQAQVSQDTTIQSTSFPFDNKNGSNIPIQMSSGGSSELTETQSYSSSLSGTNYSSSGTVNVSANAAPGSVGMDFSGSQTATTSALAAAVSTEATTTLIATVTDNLTVSAPGLPAGEGILVNAAMSLNAIVNCSASIPAYVNYSGGVNANITVSALGAGVNLIQGWAGSDSLTIDGHDRYVDPSIIIPLQLTFANQATVPLTYTIELMGNAGVNAESPATPVDPGGIGTATDNYDVDVTHSLDWDGIIGDPIDEGTGLPITDWTITSASGFNYANPVPEPSFSAIALCLIAIAPTRRRYASSAPFPAN